MADFGIVYEVDLSLRRYTGANLSNELIGPVETTLFALQGQSEEKTRKSLRVGQAGKTRGSFGRNQATLIKLSMNAVDSRLFAIIMQGTEAAITGSGGSVTGESVTIKFDTWIKLANRNLTSSTAVITGSVEGTDFEIDEKLGAIMALSTGNLTDGATVSLDYAYTAVTGTEIGVGTESKVEVYLEGPAKNSETGADAYIRIPKCTLSPTGEVSFASEDYVTIDLEGECVLLDGESADAYFELHN